jgi:[citrate (pro-3S)-lyase] ligase
LFAPLGFHPVIRTADVLLMENRRGGLGSFLQGLEKPADDAQPIGCIVANGNPFTFGHRYLIETAAKECDHLYVFVLSEDRSEFSAHDRMEMVRLGTADLANVTVLPTGPYLISSATFPTYFLKDRDGAAEVQCRLDIEIFTKHFAPRFGITRRFVGTEPISPMTARYNEALKAYLPQAGIAVREVPRLESGGAPISASRVRQSLADPAALETLLPESSLQYLKDNNLLK